MKVGELMKVWKGVVLLGLVLFPAVARAEGKAESCLETRFFHLRSSVDGAGTIDLSGMEIRWALFDPRGSFRLVLPALSVKGPPGLVSLGPTFANVRKNSSTTDGETGPPPSSGPETEDLLDPVSMNAGGQADERQYGLGDTRLQLRRQVGRDAGWGRLFIDGGTKLPTADEEDGLGTGEVDFWTGMGWKYEGWVVNLEAFVEWVRLGDPEEYTLQDGPGAGFFVEFPGGRGSFGVGLQAAKAPLEGDPARIQAVVDGHRSGRTVEWGMSASAGLSESAPDFGASLVLRF